MKRIGSFEAKTHLSRFLADVESKGEEIIIQKRGVDIAVLIPYGEFRKQKAANFKEQVLSGLREVRATFKRIPGEPPISYKEWVEDGRKW